MPVITIEVRGIPAPKGSGRAIKVGKGDAAHAQYVPSGSDANKRALRSWDASVRSEALIAYCNAVVTSGDNPPVAPLFIKQALSVTMVFRMPRPTGHWTRKNLKPGGAIKANAPEWPATKPDLSKLVRATEDSLIGLIFDDDSRIVSLTVQKRWANPGDEGATITVQEMKDGA